MKPHNHIQPDDVQTLRERGLEASRANDSALAIHYFLRYATAAPAEPQPHILLAAEYAVIGEAEKAEIEFTHALLIAPTSVIIRYQLGLLQLSSGHVTRAFHTWAPLLQLSTDSPYLHFVQGFSALTQDHFDEARLHFEQGLAQNTSTPILSKDIEKILDRISHVQRNASRANPTTTDALDTEAGHILLANYQHAGKPH